MTATKLRALVVEDDDDSRVLFQNFLEYEGYQVETAKHPDGIDNLSNYALLVMDIHFATSPVDGLEWVNAQRAAGYLTAGTKVVFTTGFEISDLKNVNHDDILPKPIELTALRKLIPEVH
jgi:CheY-like chemotaxis protein